LTEIGRLSSLNSVFRGIANRINRQQQLEDLKVLMHIYDINEATEQDAIDIATENLDWIEEHADEVQEFLDDFFSAGISMASSTFAVFIGLVITWTGKKLM
jgi:formate dehydrogenase maturation protein FdhE